MHVKDVCKRLGKLGFASAAPDLYWQRKELLNSERIQLAMEDAWGLTLEEVEGLQLGWPGRGSDPTSSA